MVVGADIPHRFKMDLIKSKFYSQFVNFKLIVCREITLYYNSSESLRMHAYTKEMKSTDYLHILNLLLLDLTNTDHVIFQDARKRIKQQYYFGSLSYKIDTI